MVNLKRLNSRVEWILKLETTSPIHIGDIDDPENPKIESNEHSALLNLNMKNAKDATCFLIPGSSFRGVTRSYLLSISEQLHSKKLKEIVENVYGYTEAEKDEKTSLKGRIWFSDVLVPRSASIEKNITPIDRITQKALPLKYTSIQPNTPFVMKITMENVTVHEYGIVALILRALEQKMITIGAGKARGFGHVQLMSCDTQITFLNKHTQTEDGYELPIEDFEKQHQLLGYLYKKKAEGHFVYTWLQFAASALEQTVAEEVNRNESCN